MGRPGIAFPCAGALLALAAAAGCAVGQRDASAKLQAALDDRVRRCDVKGASAAVVFPDGTVWSGASGVSHESVPVSPEMAFAVGSITKNMVAALALQFAEEGQLSLEDPVGKWLPPYRHVNPEITIRQMLSHSSGLFMFWENQQLWDDLVRYRTKAFTPVEVLGYLRAPDFPPGKGFHYSNTGYLITAMILTRAGGSTLSAEFRKRFWLPLGLHSACLPPEEPYPRNMGHVWGDNFEKDGSYRDITFLPRRSHDTITYGSAGVFMTAADLARWTAALFGGKVIGAESLRQMQRFGQGGYGLGLGRLGYELAGGMEAVGHGGGNIGTSAWMVYLPDYGVSVSVMVNRYGGNWASQIARDLARTSAMHLRPRRFYLIYPAESILSALWLVGALGSGYYSLRRRKPTALFVIGGLAFAAGAVSIVRGMPLHLLLLPLGGTCVAAGVALRTASRRGFR